MTFELGENVAKYLYTILLFWSEVFTGFPYGLIGPCMPDLILRLRTDPITFNYVFVSAVLPSVLGCLVASRLERALGSNLAMALTSLLCAGCQLLMPFSGHIAVFAVPFALLMFAEGAGYSVSLSTCARLWGKDAASPLHLLLCGISTGMFLAPLIAEPFLSPPECLQDIRAPSNGVEIHPNVSSTLALDCGGRIHFAFISMASLGILVGLGFLVVHLAPHSTIGREDVLEQGDPLRSEYENMEDTRSKSQTCILITLTFLYVTVGYSGLSSFTTFLTSYAMMSSHLHVTLQTMSTMTSTMTGSWTLGRLLGVIVSRKFSQTQILVANLVGLLGTGLWLVLQARFHLQSMWIASCLYAFFYAPHVAGAQSFLSDYMPLSPSLIALFTVAADIGYLVFNYLTGTLMRLVDNEVFTYMTLAYALALILLLSAIHGTVRFL